MNGDDQGTWIGLPVTGYPSGEHMEHHFTSDDRGKRVVTFDGDVIGSIERIEDGEAYVRPKAGLLGGCGSWITDTKRETHTFPLDVSEVARITDTEIRLETPGLRRVEQA